METINCLIASILQNILFCVQQKKETHTGLEWHEQWQYFYFWVNYLFKKYLVKKPSKAHHTGLECHEVAYLMTQFKF